jgi:hypothetical protein
LPTEQDETGAVSVSVDVEVVVVDPFGFVTVVVVVVFVVVDVCVAVCVGAGPAGAVASLFTTTSVGPTDVAGTTCEGTELAGMDCVTTSSAGTVDPPTPCGVVFDSSDRGFAAGIDCNVVAISDAVPVVAGTVTGAFACPVRCPTMHPPSPCGLLPHTHHPAGIVGTAMTHPEV